MFRPPHPHLLKAATEDDILQQAYEWLCKRRHDYSHNSDIWDFMLHWPRLKNHFITQVLSGTYRFSPLRRYSIDGQTLTSWSAQDALLLKAMTLVLQSYLLPRLPTCCLHLKGNGGIKEAIREVDQNLKSGRFVMRTDVRQFYDSVDHYTLYETLCSLIPETEFCRLIWHSLQHVVIYEGNYHQVSQGLSRSHPMSPLLGAIALLPLDQAMQKLPVFYCRYMDDWIIIAKSRWQLRHAIKEMHCMLNLLGFDLHPDKTSIGHVERGFDFLGYHLKPWKLSLATITADRLREKLNRLYEQGAGNRRIGEFIHHWSAAIRGGGTLFQSVDVDWVIESIMSQHFHLCDAEI
jgi:RNA-directed DNA polymerase